MSEEPAHLSEEEVAEQWIAHHGGRPPCPTCNVPMEAPIEETEGYTPELVERLPLCHEHGYLLNGELRSLDELVTLGF